MAEDTSSTGSFKNEAKRASLPGDIESQIRTTIRSRIAHFKEQSDYLTLQGVLRLLEKDLGLETLALDVRKRFVKQCLLECLDDNNGSGETDDSNSNSSSKKISDSPKLDDGVKVEEDWDKEDKEISEEKEISGRQVVPKKSYENSASVLKRKSPEKETSALCEKRIRAAENAVDNGTDAEETRMGSEGGWIQSSSTMKLMTEPDALLDCNSTIRLKNEELKKTKELLEEAQRQTEKAKEEVKIANEEAKGAKEEAEKRITGFKSNAANMEQRISDLERQLEAARALASQAIDDFKASKTCEELLVNLVGPYMEAAFHNFRTQATADFPQLENRFKQYELDYDMLTQSVGTDDESGHSLWSWGH